MADLYLLVPLLLISCVLTRLVIGIANKTSILDTPVDRSSHRHPTPLGGGIAIACTFYVAVAYMDYRGAITTFEFAALLGGWGPCLSVVVHMRRSGSRPDAHEHIGVNLLQRRPDVHRNQGAFPLPSPRGCCSPKQRTPSSRCTSGCL